MLVEVSSINPNVDMVTRDNPVPRASITPAGNNLIPNVFTTPGLSNQTHNNHHREQRSSCDWTSLHQGTDLGDFAKDQCLC